MTPRRTVKSGAIMESLHPPPRSLATARDPESWASSPGVRRSMRSNRRTDTGPERALRSALHRMGLRFRKDYRVDLDELRVRIDVAFPGRLLAVFVDGCFWHRCPVHRTDPRLNGDFWERKLQQNVERDARVNAALTSAGWTVLRCWEHEAAEAAAQRVRTMHGSLTAA